MSISLGEETLFESPRRLMPWEVPYESGDWMSVDVETPVDDEGARAGSINRGDYLRIMQEAYLPSIREMLNTQLPLLQMMEREQLPIRGINRSTYPFWRAQTQQAPNTRDNALTYDALRRAIEEME